jgi:exopolyphosphatase/guanosine-5'-triphosphate,3'-diphosphate pyrophosphatase
MAFAGSALREASNSKEILAAIKSKAGLTVQPLTVNEEAWFLYESYAADNLLPHRNYLYVDVGGGTTEIVLLENGRLAEARRFNIGTVRQLVGKELKTERQAMIEYLNRIKASHAPVAIIGTGGNINKLARLIRTTRDKAFTLRSLQLLYNKLRQISVEGRMSLFDLAPDRADVIIPACDIFILVAKTVGVTKFIVPTRGLVDGMVRTLTPQSTPSDNQPTTKLTMPATTETDIRLTNSSPFSSTNYQGEDTLDWDWMDDDDDDDD